MIEAHFSEEKIISNSAEAFSLHEKSLFGENREGKMEYSPAEALFLIKKGKMAIRDGKKFLTFENFIKKIKKKDKKIETKLSVFDDLRKRGYIIKSALKFGAEFRVYDKGARPGIEHARWILYTVRENDSLNWHDFSAKNRVAHSTKKNLLIAIVDDEGDVSYYEISWMRP
ncbi:MAG: tRNA-intron lyase [Nanoarchaeota archaeon]